MPPNIKFPSNLADIGDELINVPRSNSQAPAPPPLTENENEGGEDTFFLHDIEENVDIEALHPATEEKYHQVAQENNADEQSQSHHQHDHEHHHHHAARRVIKHLASQIDDPDELNLDEQRLARAVRDAGEFSFGVVACEVWALEDDKLVRLNSGWWHNTIVYQNNMALEDLATEQPNPITLGVDLPGILWAETVQQGTSAPPLPHNTQAIIKPSGSSGFFAHTFPSVENFMHLHTPSTNSYSNPHALTWRDLVSIQEDPDSAKTDRLGKLIEAGLCAATGVPYHVRDHRGIVIYYARSHKTTHLLSNLANDAYLRASAEMIGHTAAFAEMRRASVESRRRQTLDASDRFKRNLLDFHKNVQEGNASNDVNVADTGKLDVWDREEGKESSSKGTDEISLDDMSPPDETKWSKVLHALRIWSHKWRGGDLQVPPAMTLRQTLWTILGAFCGLLVLSSLNEYYKILSDEDYYLLIGPFGALMTLQYGLTAAPASQPRNAILGQAVSGAISLAFTYIPESILATWLRRAVGPAIAIGAMVKLGVTHPPAGAHAVLYASGKYNFGFYALVVLSSAISVIPATLVNNLSSKRQYPTYWTLIPWNQKTEK
ncbi:HPP family [Seminavis robusta]|uniref:HPP family n=1 Tax=Seminavis robusta TaxID=568900 RepID=A0A9N8E2E1_9STRA|nr:HPP family [Seminavis robusta]|eukprot:Sro581_g170280.1 HPP family (604) ;mRNA; r:27395-29297